MLSGPDPSSYSAAAAGREGTVSVVIPVKNDATPLARCLEALACQSQAPLEVIVVDNGSTDASSDVARALGARLLHEPVPGIGAASATGYDAAHGDIIARLDADSVPPANWIETIIATLTACPRVEAITGRAGFTDGPVWLRGPAASLYLGSYFFFTGLALGHAPLFGSNMAIRKGAWIEVRDAVHTRDTLTHDDLDLAFHLGPESAIRVVPDLRMGISMRPLHDGNGALRIRRGFRTIAIHWPHDLPWLRLARRILSGAKRLPETRPRLRRP